MNKEKSILSSTNDTARNENSVEEVRSYIEEHWIITKETSKRVYFKYNNMRGTPRFYFDKIDLVVVREDTSNKSSNEAISVEVKTHIYSLIFSNVEAVTAQEVYEGRNTSEVAALIDKYGGREDRTGGDSD